MRRLRHVTEADVIAEFLKNEFYTDDFHQDRDRYERLVLEPDLSNERENAVRRALLFRRRGHMWRELPRDLQWWEVSLDPGDSANLQVLSRCHWRAIAGGDFRLDAVVERVRAGIFPADTREFIEKIYNLSQSLRSEYDTSGILLIGVDEHRPMVILEGNHRLTAAALAGPELLHSRFRVICGFSPHMTRCCWYRNSVPNLLRYLKNRLVNLYDHEANIPRALASTAEAEKPEAEVCSGSAVDSKQRQFSPGG